MKAVLVVKVFLLSSVLHLGETLRLKREGVDYSDEKGRPYSFHYEVDSPYHANWHDRTEKSTGRSTEGQFRVALPDHRLQTVRYQATKEKGFMADIHFEQHPNFKSLRGNIGKAPEIGKSVVPAFKPVVETRNQIKSPSRNVLVKLDPKMTKGFNRDNIKGIPLMFTSEKSGELSETPLSAFVSLASTNHFTANRSPKDRQRTRFANQQRRAEEQIKTEAKVPIFSARQLRQKQRVRSKTTDGTTHDQPITKFGERMIPKTRVASSDRRLKSPNHPIGSNPKSSLIRFHSSRHSSGVTGRLRASSKSASLGSTQPKNLSSSGTLNNIPHEPKKPEPEQSIAEPPATQDDSFSLGGENRYSIRADGMKNIMSRLEGIVHK